jgi:4-diphosphocytidyl-2-C-methyl-D-erythritol kinase
MLSNAKLNLYLHVTGKMHVGYHSIESLLVPIGIYDNVNIAFSGSSNTLMNISGEFSHLVDSSDNLVLKAINAIYSHANMAPHGLNILLQKNIPVGGGLGGGSSNAATALKIMNRLLGLNYTNEKLKKIGAKLGADIPFFIENRASLITGIGDIETLVDIPSLYLLLIYPNMELSTADVFQYAPFEFSHKLPIINSYENHQQFISFLNICKNELEPNAIKILPQINDILTALSKQTGCLLSRMTGSGSTCFGIFKNESELNNALVKISREYPKWWVQEVVT